MDNPRSAHFSEGMGGGRRPGAVRVGIGYDTHRLEPGRPLILGGVEIPWASGLLGHSDADVLTHVIMDALLGAAGLGDIGRRFPDTDPRYKDASSIALLAEVGRAIAAEGWALSNVDAVLIAQAPKIAPYVEQMRGNVADALGVDVARIGVKGTTTEGLGFEGEGLGMSAQAVAMIEAAGG
jgi:2-C-methyl-D-erythritol 2,4-cyclodiphosphate synthase